MELGRPNQDVFAQTLLELAQQDSQIYVATSDSRGSGKLVPFGETLPEQIIEVGIAEQNLVGVAAGLASTGKKVFAVSPACFLTARALEQVKNDVAYSNNNVKVVGISAGVSYGALGSTHHSLHDYAALRAINNIDIIVPADNFETREAVKALINHPRPAYLRFGKKAMPHLHSADAKFEIGKAIKVREGQAATIISIGEPTADAVMAADLLAQDGIDCRVLSVHSLRPFDTEALLDAAANTGAIITVEEHSVYGGLGELCAGILMQKGIQVPFKVVGFPDEYTVTGSQTDIFRHYGISAEGLAATVKGLLTPVEA